MRAAQHAHPADAVPATEIGRFSCAILDLKVFPIYPAARLMRKRWATSYQTYRNIVSVILIGKGFVHLRLWLLHCIGKQNRQSGQISFR